MIFAEVFPCSGVVVSIKEKVESTLLERFHPAIETGSWIANVLRAMFLLFYFDKQEQLHTISPLASGKYLYCAFSLDATM